MNSEKNCYFVSSRGIAFNCEVYPKNILSDTKSFNVEDYKNIKNGDKVYVVSSVLKEFVTKIFPSIVKNNICITLVTGACVISVPNELSKIHKFDYIKFVKNNKKYIHRWYTQNCDILNDEDIKVIPLGLDYHTLQKYKSHEWGVGKSALEQEKDLLNIRDLSKNESKKIMTFSYYHFVLFNRHNRDRYLANEHLRNKSFNVFLKHKMKRNDTWREQVKYYFVISPHGNGLDCHRTWEALALGCIPILKTSTLNSLFNDLPVLIVDNWSDINEKLLIDTLSKFNKKEFNLDKLSLKYWSDYIKQ